VLLNMESKTVTLANGSTQVQQTVGCGLGPLTDFVTIAATAPAVNISNPLQSTPDTTAHELGHICNLSHVKAANEVGYMMFSNDDNLVDGNGRALVRTGTDIYDWQAIIIRSSRHVSYF
jgi:hypothetical protein